MYDASTPSILSSIIILDPASPNDFFVKIVSIASLASSLFLQTITPFPAARPSAFITTGFSYDFTKSLAFCASSNISKSAVGIEFRFMNSFAQILLDSNFAAFLEGPKIGRPFSTKASTMPAASGSSGPTTVKQFFS